jgi:hypothetical protein
MPAAGPAFYARVYHPAFNLDLEDAEDTLHCFQTHTKAVGKGIQRLRTVFGRVRESRIGIFLSLHSSSLSKNSSMFILRNVKSRTSPLVLPSLLDHFKAFNIHIIAD